MSSFALFSDDLEINVTEKLEGLLLSNFGNTGHFVYIPGMTSKLFCEKLVECQSEDSNLFDDVCMIYQSHDTIMGNVQDENPVVRSIVEILFQK